MSNKLATFEYLPGYQERGSTLIEILVAVLVLSLGMLGMASLQTRGLQFNQSSFYQSQAAFLAEDIFDRMRANRSSLGTYLHKFTDSIPSSYTNCQVPNADCKPSEMAEYDRITWLNEVALVLPSGQAQISRDTSSGTSTIYIVTLQFNDSRVEDASTFGQKNTTAPKQYTFRTEI